MRTDNPHKTAGCAVRTDNPHKTVGCAMRTDNLHTKPQGAPCAPIICLGLIG